MPSGTVKWFNDQKGYGFIKQDGVAEDIFVHHTAIKMDGFRTLAPGDTVDFEVKQDEKGLKAVNVSRTGTAPEGEGAPEGAPEAAQEAAPETATEAAPEAAAEASPEAAV